MNALQSRKSKAGKWPAKVTCGNTTVSVYRRTMPNGQPGYMVADFSTGKRRFISFPEPGPALAEAERIARLLAAGEVEAAAMAGPERASYGRAVELLRETGVSLEVAAATFAECCNVLHGNRLLEACKFYAARHRQVTRKPVAELVGDFIKLRESRGASERYIGDLRARLGRFAADCRKDASDVSTADIQGWLDSLKAAPQTVKNFRTVLFTLFEHAVARGFAHDNPVAGSEVGKVRGGEIEIFTPAEFRKLLAAAKPDFLPVLLLGGLAGLRSAELERLEWGDIDLARRCIVVGASKSKTASRRVVPVCDALAAWLAPYAGRTGLVWPGGHDELYERQQETAAAAELTWKANGLRHSYASYRFAELGDAGRVAGELGNSAAVVHKHYRELVKPGEAAVWFSIRPEAPGNIISIPAAANA